MRIKGIGDFDPIKTGENILKEIEQKQPEPIVFVGITENKDFLYYHLSDAGLQKVKTGIKKLTDGDVLAQIKIPYHNIGIWKSIITDMEKRIREKPSEIKAIFEEIEKRKEPQNPLLSVDDAIAPIGGCK